MRKIPFGKSASGLIALASLTLMGCHEKKPSTDLHCGNNIKITQREGQIADDIYKQAFYRNENVDLATLSSVRVEGDSLVYSGPLLYQSLVKIDALYNKNPHIQRVKINSPGGVTVLGLCLGEFIYEKNLDVEVTGKVFSSAANYVFTAGNKKIIHKDSVIGFHGGEASTRVNDMDAGDGASAQDNTPQTDDIFSTAKTWEAQFYQKLGIDLRLVTAGQEDKYASKDKTVIGWTYTLDAFKALGVNNFVLPDGEWSVNTRYSDKESLFVIDTHDLVSSSR